MNLNNQTGGILLVWILTAGVAHAQSSANPAEPFRPAAIDDCIKDKAFTDRFVIDFSTNPFYLRGDFNGDGKMRYAFAIRDKRRRSLGLAVCDGSTGALTLLGQVAGEKFSDMEEDNFISQDWEVYENSALKGLFLAMDEVPAAKGEVIAMIWEDGVGLIYFDGKSYKWRSVPL
jgi:hypothetical protein